MMDTNRQVVDKQRGWVFGGCGTLPRFKRISTESDREETRKGPRGRVAARCWCYILAFESFDTERMALIEPESDKFVSGILFVGL